MCLKAWRFGEPLEVGGLGTDRRARRRATRRPAGDRSTATRCTGGSSRKTLCGASAAWSRADVHLSGRVRSVELAAVGRRVAEQEWDLIELLAPEACRAALAAPLSGAAPRRRRGSTGGRPPASCSKRCGSSSTEQVMAERRPRAGVPRAGRGQHARHRRTRACHRRSLTAATTGSISRSPSATGSSSRVRGI